MTRKRFVKLHMADGYSRDEAEFIALLVQNEDRRSPMFKRSRTGKLLDDRSYAYWYSCITISDKELARLMLLFKGGNVFAKR